jgi:hypothetical protein
MSTTKYHTKSNRVLNLNYLIKIMYFLLLLGLMLSAGNKTFASCVTDLKTELDNLKTGECVTITQSTRTGFYNVESGSVPAIPAVEVKGADVVTYINSCLEEFSSISVMKAERNGYFYVFDPGYDPYSNGGYRSSYGYNPYGYSGYGSYGGSYGYNPYGYSGYGGYGDPYGYSPYGYSGYGASYGLPFDGIYRYGSGIDSMVNFGGMFDPYSAILGLYMGLYNNPFSYQGGSSGLGSFAQGLFTAPIFGSSGLGLDPLSSLLLMYGNTPFNNRTNAIPSENSLLNSEPALRSAHFNGLINPVYSGYGFASNFSMSPLTCSNPLSVFGAL